MTEKDLKTSVEKTTTKEENLHMHTHVEENHYVHTHVDENGNTYTHSHDHHGHTHHGHEHPNAKAVSNRLARAIGHLESVKRMVDQGEDCSQVLIQLAAVRSAITNAGKVLLMDHLNHCIVDAVEQGDMQMIEELNEAIKKFIK